MRDSQTSPESPTPIDPASPLRHRWMRILAPAAALALVSGGVAVATVGGSSPDKPVAPASTATGIAPASASDDSPGSTEVEHSTTSSDDVANPGTELADGASTTFPVGVAGTVTVQRTGSTLLVTGTTTNAGWTVTVERASGAEVEVEFSDGTTKLHFEAELEHGGVQVKVETRAPGRDDSSNSGPSSNSGRGSSNSGPDSSGGGSNRGSGSSGGSNDGPNHQ